MAKFIKACECPNCGTLCKDDGLIILCMAGETGKGSVIATYSTSEKAEKAMEMLRTA